MARRTYMRSSAEPPTGRSSAGVFKCTESRCRDPYRADNLDAPAQTLRKTSTIRGGCRPMTRRTCTRSSTEPPTGKSSAGVFKCTETRCRNSSPADTPHRLHQKAARRASAKTGQTAKRPAGDKGKAVGDDQPTADLLRGVWSFHLKGKRRAGDFGFKKRSPPCRFFGRRRRARSRQPRAAANRSRPNRQKALAPKVGPATRVRSVAED